MSAAAAGLDAEPARDFRDRMEAAGAASTAPGNGALGEPEKTSLASAATPRSFGDVTVAFCGPKPVGFGDARGVMNGHASEAEAA
ncbi:MAG TPA: hypothetical protein VF702_03555 [Allosphingosinicella sp.]|jgi:hypothetical protein